MEYNSMMYDIFLKANTSPEVLTDRELKMAIEFLDDLSVRLNVIYPVCKKNIDTTKVYSIVAPMKQELNNRVLKSSPLLRGQSLG